MFNVENNYISDTNKDVAKIPTYLNFAADQIENTKEQNIAAVNGDTQKKMMEKYAGVSSLW